MKLLTVSNTAALLQCSEGTVRRWANVGRLQVYVRLADGSRLFRESDVRELARQRDAASTRPPIRKWTVASPELTSRHQDANDTRAVTPAADSERAIRRRAGSAHVLRLPTLGASGAALSIASG